ncbi:MAG: hypothetical protein Q8O13_03265 [Candidatus Omnitrophota bacterium]|nr:hypothetical protein [Candidatus Omnitrophota bacterium]
MQKLDFDRVKNLYWDENCSVKEIAGKLGFSFWSVYSFMNTNNIHRRAPSEVNYATNKYKPQFKFKQNLNIPEQELKIAGIMLYWAEGTLRNSTVDFANSNPQMIKIFLKFLREICGVNEERLRVYLYAYSYHQIEKIKLYWSKVTNVPLNQFTKPYIRNGNPNLSQRKLPYGLIHIRYNDKRLLGTIKFWIDEYLNNNGQVPKWLKGTDCRKCSVPSKDGMEK